MSSLGRALIQYDWCLHEKGKFGHRLREAQREEDVKTQREDSRVTKMTCL